MVQCGVAIWIRSRDSLWGIPLSASPVITYSGARGDQRVGGWEPTDVVVLGCGSVPVQGLEDRTLVEADVRTGSRATPGVMIQSKSWTDARVRAMAGAGLLAKGQRWVQDQEVQDIEDPNSGLGLGLWVTNAVSRDFPR